MAEASKSGTEEGYMRLRLVALACAWAALGTVLAPSIVQAAPHHNHHLTIAATPNPVPAGEGVLIYGRLEGPGSGGQTIRLYQHVRGSGQGYSFAGSTNTDSTGFYEFNGTAGSVDTNRNWFARGPDRAHSRTVHEFVNALVSINASSTNTDTKHPILFTGSVTPNHAFERVFLQQRIGSSDDWRTLKSGRLDSNSAYAIAYRWRRPGEHDVRVLFRGDFRNLRGFSDLVTVTIQQAQVPDFTINSSAPITPAGSSVTISGTLFEPGTSTPEPNTVVQLWGRNAYQDRFVVLDDTTTHQDGSYSFNQAGLSANTVYYVATMPLAHVKRRHTARLFEGVQDVLTIQSSTSTATVGQLVTFSGTILPDKAGHLVYLQKLDKDGDFHTVEVRFVHFGSTYRFGWRFGAPGTFQFRARVTSDGVNVGARSQPVTVTVTAPPASSLPPAS
jgi:hypothetical protein